MSRRSLLDHALVAAALAGVTACSAESGRSEASPPPALSAPDTRSSPPAPGPPETASMTDPETSPRSNADTGPGDASSPSTARATFAGGCFWCVEAVYEQLDGVLDVTSGYMGGTLPEPTYRQVCSGDTGHAEVVRITFDPKRIQYETLLEWFWQLHDPTTLNRQGADVGTQYRSAIFYHDDEQRRIAEASKKAAGESGAFSRPIVTEVTQASEFYPAEDYHQDYYRENSRQGYCQMVIAPKLKKLGLETK